MNYKIEYLKDIVNNTYVGVPISKDAVTSYLKQLKDILGDDEYKVYTTNQQNRDASNGRDHAYHITIINAFELNKLMKTPESSKYVEYLDTIMNTVSIDDIKMKGIGMAKKDSNTAFFVVVESDMLTELLNKIGLPKKDFHITLGFNKLDVHGVRKNEVLKMKSKLKMKIEYLKSMYSGLSFIYKISNFDENLIVPLDEVKELELTDTVYKISIKNTIIGIALVDDSLRVVYQKNND